MQPPQSAIDRARQQGKDPNKKPDMTFNTFFLESCVYILDTLGNLNPNAPGTLLDNKTYV